MRHHLATRRNWTTVAFAISLSALLGCGKAKQADAQQSTPTNSVSAQSTEAARPTSPKKLALLVGINTYKKYGYSGDVSPLEGTLNDVDAMQRVLTSQAYGFDPKNIHVLKNEQATRDAIVKKEIEGFLIKNAEPGAIIVFHFSGHGSRMLVPVDKDPSGYYNTIVPYDSRDPGNKIWDIVDKELNVRLRRLSDIVGPLGGVTFILDSCHSGTGAKAAGLARQAPDDLRFSQRAPAPDLAGLVPGARDVTGSGYSDKGIHYVLIAGSRTDQVSFERQKGFDHHGALSYYLTQELEKPAARQRTYRDIMIPVIQAVNQEFPNQVPQLEGDNKNNVIFGDKSISVQNYLVARPAEQKQVELQGGEVQGLTVGSEFDVYSLDAQKLEPPDKPVARIRLSKVEPFKSRGQIILGGPVLTPTKAVERMHAFESAKTRVYYDNLAKAPRLQEIKNVLDRHPSRPFESVTDGQLFQLRLEERAGQIRTFGADGVELSTALPTNTPDLAAAVERRMLAWARWFGLRTLNHSGSGVNAAFDLIPTGSREPAPHDRIPVFTPGKKRFTLRIKNLSTSKKLFVYVLDQVSTGEVHQVYPDLGTHIPLDPLQQIEDDDWNPGLPEPKNGERRITKVRDILKLLVATDQVDLGYLEMETPRGTEARSVKAPPSDPLNQLLFEAAIGNNRARNVTRGVPDDWATAEVSFDVCAQVDGTGKCK